MKKKVIKVLALIVISVCFILSGIHFTNTNKIAEELGFEGLKNITIGKSRQIENILPDKNAISVFNLGYLVNEEIGLSFFSITRLIAIMIITYKFMEIITKDKKIKILGMLGIAFSSLVLMDMQNKIIDIIIFSEMILISCENILYNKKSNVEKYLYALLMILSYISIGLLFSVELLICSLFITIPFIIYIWSKKNEKENKKIFFISIILSLIFITSIFCIGKNYLDTTLNNQNRNVFYLLNYFNNTFLNFTDISYLSEYVSIYSLFPIPLIIAIMVVLKSDKKENNFLFITILMTTWLIMGVCMNFADSISKILLIGFISTSNLNILISLFSFITALYILDKSELNMEIKTAVTIVFITVILTVFALRPIEISGTVCLIISAAVFSILGYMICRRDEKKYRKVFTVIFSIYFIIVAITQINISFGADILKENEFSKFIKELEDEKQAKWLVLDSNYILPEYLELLDLKVINKNDKLIEKYKFVNETNLENDILWYYYDETIFNIGNENVIKLNEENNVVIEITNEYLEENVDYVVSNKEIEEKEEIYNNGKIFVYKY